MQHTMSKVDCVSNRRSHICRSWIAMLTSTAVCYVYPSSNAAQLEPSISFWTSCGNFSIPRKRSDKDDDPSRTGGIESVFGTSKLPTLTAPWTRDEPVEQDVRGKCENGSGGCRGDSSLFPFLPVFFLVGLIDESSGNGEIGGGADDNGIHLDKIIDPKIVDRLSRVEFCSMQVIPQMSDSILVVVILRDRTLSFVERLQSGCSGADLGVSKCRR